MEFCVYLSTHGIITLYGIISCQMGEWIDRLTEWKNQWKDRWRDGRMDGWRDGGWRDGEREGEEGRGDEQ